MRVLLLRHGKTPGNAVRRYIGRTDEPLSEAGAAEARALGGVEGVERVYVTPLRRTGETAALLFPRARQIVVPGLREMDFGDFEGRSPDEMESDAAYRAWVDAQCLPPCPHGEDKDGFSRRVCAAFEETILTHRGEYAVFVVHGGTVMAVLSRYARPPRGFYENYVENCRGFCAALSPGAEGLPFLLTGVERVEQIREALG